MIKEEVTLTGNKISLLSPSSGQRVIRICDFCKKEQIITWRAVQKTRTTTKRQYGQEKDRCQDCQINEVMEKRVIKNKNIKPAHKDSHGYPVEFVKEHKRYEPIHRQIMTKHLGREIAPTEEIHHLDGNKQNNSLNNLKLCLSKKHHGNLHGSLEKVAFECVRNNIILFNEKTDTYFLNPESRSLCIPLSLGFSDIAIKQKKNICNSRSEVDLTSEVIRGIIRPLPLIASNMSTVIDEIFYLKLWELGAMGIMHRAMTNSQMLSISTYLAKKCPVVAMSIGVGNDQFDLAKALISHGTNVLVIDVAHGFNNKVLELATNLKSSFPQVKLVLGNTVNPDMLLEVRDCCDAIKVGIAQGFACETANTAGCTEKQFSVILKFKNLAKELNIPIISDGGLREPADFVKAIGAGANSVMAGKIFAACPESAAEIESIGDKPKKVYAGMASRLVQEKWHGNVNNDCPEGGVRYLDIGESSDKLLARYAGALRSGITYAGAKDIKSFQETVEFVRFK